MMLPLRWSGLPLLLLAGSCFPSFELSDGGAGGEGNGGPSGGAGAGESTGGFSQAATSTGPGGGGEGGGTAIVCTPGMSPWRSVLGGVTTTAGIDPQSAYLQSITFVGNKAFVGGYTEASFADVPASSFFVAELDYLEPRPSATFHRPLLAPGLAPKISLAGGNGNSIWIAVGSGAAVHLFERSASDLDLGGAPSMTCTNAWVPDLGVSGDSGFAAMEISNLPASCTIADACVIEPEGSSSVFVTPLPLANDACAGASRYWQESEFRSEPRIAAGDGVLFMTVRGGSAGVTHMKASYDGDTWSDDGDVGTQDSTVPTFLTPLVHGNEAYVAGTVLGDFPRTFVEGWDGAFVWDSDIDSATTVFMRTGSTNGDWIHLAGATRTSPVKAWRRRIGGLTSDTDELAGVESMITASATDECGNVLIAGTYQGSNFLFGGALTEEEAPVPTAFIQFIPYDMD
ncbi:MAG: hypothetical protein HOW73_06775 [Polyangiaceae bacterium]|nr:hypothetical protein [Polyangiaceae bacterium]